ncbi:hypothetical protein PT144_05120 (plasmid) [Borreliella garinii]|nr:hypothetical protein [Borreliella garinii]WRM49129.1 hypothetical protein PT144_05120 [Borreliella garinii]
MQLSKNSSDSYSIFLNAKSVILDFISSPSFKDCQKSENLSYFEIFY